jgi:hypothetical protein
MLTMIRTINNINTTNFVQSFVVHVIFCKAENVYKCYIKFSSGKNKTKT